MRAAVLRAIGEPLRIESLRLAEPVGREVLVRTMASGVCHSDLHFIEGLYPIRTPVVLGHEAAGVVEAVGPEVTEFAPGDHVVACLSTFCGRCERCLSGETHLCTDKPRRARGLPPVLSTADGEAVGQGLLVAGYAERMLLHENGVVKIDPAIPFAQAALIGCGVTTGVGAVLKTARVEAGATVAIWGCGGVGLAAVQGARIVGARRIIAIDRFEHKLKAARDLGATHTVDASVTDPVQAVRDLTDGGVDYAFEAIGLAAAAEQCFEALRPGGTATIVGMIPVGERVSLPGNAFLLEKKVIGCSMGSNQFKLDMPRYLELYQRGLLRLDEMISATARLDEINDCMRAMKAGEVTRSVLLFDGA